MELLHRQAFFMKHFAAMPQNMKRILRCIKRHCVLWSKAWRLHSAIFLAKNAFMGLPSLHSGYPAFLQKKWRRAFFCSPTILKGILSSKTQNFDVKWNCKNHFKYEREYSDECYSRKYVVNSPGNSTSCFISPIRLIGFSLGIINPPSCFLCGRYLW